MEIARYRLITSTVVLALLFGLALAAPASAGQPPSPNPTAAGTTATGSVGTLALPYCNARSTFSWRGHAIDLPVASGNNPSCIMARGAFSWGVFSLQESLVYCHGQNTGGLDRDYGPSTEQAVWNVQSALSITRDGVYGPQTRNAMRSSSSGSNRGWWAIPGYCTGR